MSINEKMTAIANEIRTLSGETGSMGLDAMASNIGEANTAVDTQADLIDQIANALANKAANGGASVETCTFVYNSSNLTGIIYYTSFDTNTNEIIYSQANFSSSITINCLCNSIVTIIGSSNKIADRTNAQINCTILNINSLTGVFAITAAAGETASYTYSAISTGGSN